MIKEAIKTIGKIILINIWISILHFWALIGVTFNDSGATFSSLYDLLPNLTLCLGPLIIASIILIEKKFKESNKYKVLAYILQITIILLWINAYTDVYIK